LFKVEFMGELRKKEELIGNLTAEKEAAEKELASNKVRLVSG
jgi:hypothetical protein